MVVALAMMPTRYVQAELLRFLRAHSSDVTSGSVQARGVVELLYSVLGEHDNHDGGGVSKRTLRRMLNDYKDPASGKIPLLSLRRVLCDMSIGTFTESQWADFLATVDVAAIVPIEPELGGDVVADAPGALVADSCVAVPDAPGGLYGDLTRGELVQELDARDRACLVAKREVKMIRKRVAYWRGQAQRHKQALVGMKNQLENLNSLVLLRPGARNVSVRGGYWMALKRATGHGGAAQIVDIMAGSEHQGALKDRNMVYRYEHNAALCQRVAARSFFDENQIAIQEVGLGDAAGQDIRVIEIVAYQGDATNDNAVEKSKVQVGFVSSALLHDDECVGVCSKHNAGDDSAHAILPSMEQCLDILRIEKHETLSATDQNIAVMKKQLKSINAPLWDERASGRTPGLLSVFGFSLDSGPDNVAAMGKIVQAVKGSTSVVVVTFFLFYPPVQSYGEISITQH